MIHALQYVVPKLTVQRYTSQRVLGILLVVYSPSTATMTANAERSLAPALLVG